MCLGSTTLRMLTNTLLHHQLHHENAKRFGEKPENRVWVFLALSSVLSLPGTSCHSSPSFSPSSQWHRCSQTSRRSLVPSGRAASPPGRLCLSAVLCRCELATMLQPRLRRTQTPVSWGGWSRVAYSAGVNCDQSLSKCTQRQPTEEV
jgi:hypothetical protein